MICVSTDIDKQETVMDLAKVNKGSIYAVIGIHPNNIKRTNDKLQQTRLDSIRSLALQSECVAIGYCGIDFERDVSTHYSQEQLLEQQLHLAAEIGLPIVLFYDSKAFERFLEKVTEFKFNWYKLAIPTQVEQSIAIFDFNGTDSDLQALLALEHNATNPEEKNFYVYFIITGSIADNTDKAVQLQNQLQKFIKPERILLGTNAPFYTPQNITDRFIRENRNEPSNIYYVVDTIAKVLKLDPYLLIPILRQNIMTFYKITDIAPIVVPDPTVPPTTISTTTTTSSAPTILAVPTPEVKSSTTNSAAISTVAENQWHWKERDDADEEPWEAYSKEHNLMIDEARKKGDKKIMITMDSNKGKTIKYEIDLVRMKQTNLKTKYERDVMYKPLRKPKTKSISTESKVPTTIESKKKNKKSNESKPEKEDPEEDEEDEDENNDKEEAQPVKQMENKLSKKKIVNEAAKEQDEESDDENEDDEEGLIKYACKKCRHILFTEDDLLESPSNTEFLALQKKTAKKTTIEDDVTQLLFIKDMEWIHKEGTINSNTQQDEKITPVATNEQEVDTSEGKVNCPECGIKIGRWMNVNASPMFFMKKKTLDVILSLQEAQASMERETDEKRPDNAAKKSKRSKAKKKQTKKNNASNMSSFRNKSYA